MSGFFYLLIVIAALAGGTSTLLSVPDPVLRMTLAPAVLTILFLLCGTTLLLRRERLIVEGPDGAIRTNEPERPAMRICTSEDAALPQASRSAFRTNEPEEPAKETGARKLLGQTAGIGSFLRRRRNRDTVEVEVEAATISEPDEPDLVLSLSDLVPSAATEPAPPATVLAPNQAERTNEPEAKIRFGAFTLFRRNPTEPERTNEPEPLLEPAVPIRRMPTEPDLLAGALDPADGEPARPEPSPVPLLRPGTSAAGPVSLTLDMPVRRPGEPLRQEPAHGRQSVAEAIQEDQLKLVRVPVVSLPQRRRRMVSLHLECRHEGAMTDAHRLIGDDDGELRAALDLELARAAVKAADRPVSGAENLPVLAHLSVGSFTQEEARHALGTLLGRRSGQACPLTLILDSWPVERAGLDLVAILRKAGIGIGLELVGHPNLSPDAIAARRLGMICLTADDLHQASLGAYDSDLMKDIRAMQRAGVEVVVTGIRSERALVEVLDFPVHLGTGELFERIGT